MASNIAFFGGTFDPFHLGHLHVLNTYQKAAKPEQILIIPNHQNPLKSPPQASSRHRLKMCQLGIQGHANWAVWDWEMQQPRPSRTLDTINQLRQIYPDRGLTLIVGEDNVRTMPDWYRFQDAISDISVAVILRTGDHLIKPQLLKNIPAKFHEKFTLYPAPVSPISATLVRAYAGKGLDISQWVPKAISEYMYQNQVYSK